MAKKSVKSEKKPKDEFDGGFDELPKLKELKITKPVKTKKEIENIPKETKER